MEPNCAQCYSNNGTDGCLAEIEVDADVAGIGVLVAFFLAALVTCITIFWGYLSDALPQSMLTPSDERLIEAYQASYMARRIEPLIYSYWLFLKSSSLRILHLGRIKFRPALSRDRRVEATTRFLLGLSDQQLITGLAILIAALSNRIRLTIYELQIVFCLAWFSATTHIATLEALREYLYDHAVVRNWRVLGIFVFVVMITLIQIMLILASDPLDAEDGLLGLPAQCVFNGFNRKHDYDTYNIMSQTFTLAYLILLYLPPTIALFSDPRKGRKFDVRNAVTMRFFARKRGNIQRIRTRERWSLYTTARLQNSVTSKGDHRYEDSFLSSIPSILFSLAYGISQTVTVTWTAAPRTTGDQQVMGFGQVVAIALLAIPMLAGAEIYNEVTRVDTMRHTRPDSQDQPNTQEHVIEIAQAEFDTRQRAFEGGPTTTDFETLHRGLSTELWRHAEFQQCTPFQRHFTIMMSLAQIIRKNDARTHNHSKLIEVLQDRLVGIDATLEIVLNLFAGIALGTSGALAFAGTMVMVILAAIKLVRAVSSFGTDCRTLRSQLDHLHSNRKWYEDNFEHVMDEQDRLLFLFDGKAEEEGEGEEGSSSTGSFEADPSRPRRQDTEADIGMGVMRRRTTDRAA